MAERGNNHWFREGRHEPLTNHCPKPATAQVVARWREVEPDDNTEVWIVAKQPVTVFDFYRGRPG
jgi:hypothetical protein